MINAKINPSFDSKWIKYILVFDDIFENELNIQKFLPNQNIALVYQYKKTPEYSINFSDYIILPRVYFVLPYQAKQFVHIKFFKSVGTIVFVIEPEALFSLEGYNEIRDKNKIFVGVDELDNPHFKEIKKTFEEFTDIPSLLEKTVNLINNQNIIVNFKNQILTKALDYIKNGNGKLKIEELASKCNTTQRTLERYFKQELNITPQNFCRIIKFENSLKIVKTTKKKEVKEMIFDLDFYDYSHFLKTFKQIAGELPSSYVNNYFNGNYSMDRFFSND